MLPPLSENKKLGEVVKKIIWLISIVIALLVMVSGGCVSPSSTPPPSNQPSNPTIFITYAAVFTTQDFLIVDMTIENKGYDSFNTSPEYFSVVVANGEYSYDPSRSDMETVDLPDGGKLSGKLTFQVPSGTASNRVGFSMKYSGVRLYNVWWNEAPTTTTPGTTDTTVSNPVVIIKYSPAFVLLDSRNMLVVNVSIENKGYDSFNTSLEYFYVMVSNAKYRCDPALSDLRTVDVPNGGKILGKLAFEVPTGTASSKVGYKLVYSGTRLYNVWWVEVP